MLAIGGSEKRGILPAVLLQAQINLPLGAFGFGHFAAGP